MSQENVAVVGSYFDAVNRGDFAAAMAPYADVVVLVVDERVVPTNAGVFTGRGAVGACCGALAPTLVRPARACAEGAAWRRR